MRLPRPADALRWLPALTAIAYVTTVAVMSPTLIHALYWDTDVAAPFVLAERLRGSGPVYIPHYGSWAQLWWLLATRELPGHVEVWEATGYPFALGAAALLAWATARVAGKWAGVTAAATALIVGPLALRSLLTVIYHVSAPFTAAVLAAYLVTLGRSRSRMVSAALLAGVGLLAGVNAAGDTLLWFAGIAPFAIAASLLVWINRRGDVALQAGVTLAVTVVTAVGTSLLMRGLGFHVFGLEFRAAHLADLAGNTRHLGRMVALLGGANYAVPGPYPREPLRLLLGLLVFAAVAATILAAFKHIARRSEPITRAYACYWAASTVLLGLAFVVTPNARALGAGSANYLLTFPLAAGAGVGLLAAGSRRGQVAVALAIGVAGALNMAGIVQGRAGTAKGAIGLYKQPLVHLLEREGVTRGYAGYWDAQNLSWQSDMRLRVAPIIRCDLPGEPRLCGFTFSTIRSWYEERPGRSFLIVDPTTAFITEAPPVARTATASYRFGPLVVYLFDYDLARHIRPPQP